MQDDVKKPKGPQKAKAKAKAAAAKHTKKRNGKSQSH